MKRKVIASISIIFIMVCTILLATMNVSKADVSATVDGVTYQFRQSGSTAYEVRITDVPEGTTTISIPEYITYNGSNYRVYTLGNQSNNLLYSVSSTKRDAITTINVPNTVYQINKYCFSNLSYLENINLGTGVQYVNGYAFNRCGIKELTIPDSVRSIETTAFQYNSKLEVLHIGRNVTNSNMFSGIKNNPWAALKEITVSNDNTYMKAEDNVVYTKDMKKVLYAAPLGISDDYTMPNTIEELDNDAFIYGVFNGNVTLSPNLKTIANYAFNKTKFENGVTIPNGVTSIGYGAFAGSTLPGSLVIPDSVLNIGDYAFNECKNITSLTLSDNTTAYGTYAFGACSGLTGEFTFNPSNVTIVNTGLFSGTKYDKFIVGCNITELKPNSFSGYDDIWIDNTEGNVTIGSNVGNNDLYIHWKGDTHDLFMNSLPGVKLINTATNEEVVAGTYDCCTTFNYKVVVEDGYSYQDLSIITIDGDDYDNAEVISCEPGGVYEFKELIRDRKLYIQNISTTDDLALRTYVNKVNGIYIQSSRAPEAELINGSIQYHQTKYPVSVKKNDIITLNVRVYNEGLVDSSVNKVAVYIPDGVEFIEDNATNTSYGWTCENGKCTSEYLKGKEIGKYAGLGFINYIEFPICVKVTANQADEENVLRAIFAEIDEVPNGDSDSTCGNVDTSNTTSYMVDEISATNSESCFESQEDDDDFDSVVINSKIKVEYNLKIDKISSENDELLYGATFELYDVENNKIGEAVSDVNGAVDFGTITSYGEGIDVFYIKEVKAPAGFYLPESKSIKVEVEKKIINEFEGTYSVVIRCDTREYKVDTSKLDYIPVSSAADLAKIGSGETVTIDGIDYEFAAEANYQLTADIDLAGSNWTPIAVEVKGIFDGNGHKISNLTISEDAPTTKEFGLFSVYTGIIENLELENVAIEVGAYDEDATSLSGKSGTGAIVGVMREGYIIDCTVSGSVQSSEDNLGGFVGHTLEDGLVVIDKCENNTTVTSARKNNVGGIIGCALGSISVNNSTNNGVVSGGDFNNGGLVGYVLPSRYQDLSISGANDEDEQQLEFYVTNTEVSGEYTVTLETIKKSDESLLPGATYTVYDSNKNVVTGLDHVTLTEGRLQLFVKDINTIGTDVYYIKENETVPGYNNLIGVVRADIEKYWNENSQEYKVRVVTNILTDDEFESDTIADSTQPSKTGIFLNKEEIFTETKVAKANWRTSKAEFINCKNTEVVSGVNAIAGIVGASHGYTCIEKCTNSAEITTAGGNTPGKTAGIIAELVAWKNGDIVSIIDCENTAAINGNTSPSKKATAGIVAECIADARIENCTNSATVTSFGDDSTAGIAGCVAGKISVKNCSSSGDIIQTQTSNNGSKPTAAGIIGKVIWKNRYALIPLIGDATATMEDNIINVDKCTVTGNIEAFCHVGGIIGAISAEEMNISDCSISNLTIKQYNAGDQGGIVGLAHVRYQKVSNCDIDELEFTYNVAGPLNNTYGQTGGIIGNSCMYGFDYSYGEDSGLLDSNSSVIVIGCNVTDSQIISKSHQVGGIIGNGYFQGDITITNCNVKDSKVENSYITNYTCAGGIIANTFDSNSIIINNCNVENTPVQATTDCGGGNTCVGGIIAHAGQMGDRIEITDCSYSGNNLLNERHGDSTGNTAGIIGYGWAPNVCIENVCVSDAEITTYNGNCGGIMGVKQNGNLYGVSVNNLYFNNCTLKNTYVHNKNCGSAGSNEVTGGIIAYSATGGHFFKCKVDNCVIEYEPYSPGYNAGGSGVGGILGVGLNGGMGSTGAKYEIVDCIVKDTDIIDRAAYAFLSCIGGAIGYVDGKTVISNTDVIGCTMLGKASVDGIKNPANVGGIIGCALTGANIDNCTVDDCTLTNNCPNTQDTNITLGGVIGASPSADFTITNSDISNIEITGSVGMFGGVIGVCTKTVKLDNVDLSNITINDTGINQGRTRGIGGAIGYAITVDIKNCTADNIDITSSVMAVGGLVGATREGTASNIEMSDVTINDDQKSSLYGSGSYVYANAGGVFGCIGGYNSDDNFTASNISIDTLELTTSFEMAGGMAGYARENSTFNGCTVKNATIVMNKTMSIPNQNGSCFIGTSGSSLKLDKCKVIDSSLTINEYASGGPTQHAGGFIGYTPNADITDSSIEGTTITNKIGCAGGIVGIAEENTSITGTTVEDTDVTSISGVGGVASVFKGTLTDVEISGSTITTTADDDTGYAGGIVGVLEGTLSNSTVDDVDVTSAGGNVGGAIGATTGTVDTVTVKNSTIQSPKIAGGVVGAGLADATTLLNLTIENNTITSTGTSGDYIGSPDIYNP